MMAYDKGNWKHIKAISGYQLGRDVDHEKVKKLSLDKLLNQKKV